MTGKLQLTDCKILHLLLQIQQLYAAAGVTSVWITAFCSTECFGCSEQTHEITSKDYGVSICNCD